MAASYQSLASAVGATSCDAPSGTSNGDLLIAHVWVFDSSTISAMSGGASWLPLIDSTSRTHNSFTGSFRVFYKIAGASEPGSYSVTRSGSGFCDIIITRYAAGTFDAADPMGASSINSGGSSPVTGTGITVEADSVIGLFSSPYPVSTNNPTGMTQRASIDGNSVRLHEQTISGAGATGNKTYTISGTGIWGAVLYEIRAAASDTTGTAALTAPGGYASAIAAALGFKATAAPSTAAGYASSIAAALGFKATAAPASAGGYTHTATGAQAFRASPALSAPGGYVSTGAGAIRFTLSSAALSAGGYSAAIDAALRFTASAAHDAPGAYIMDAEGEVASPNFAGVADLLVGAPYGGASGGQTFRAANVALSAPGGYAATGFATSGHAGASNASTPGGYTGASAGALRFLASASASLGGLYSGDASGAISFAIEAASFAPGGYTGASAGALRFVLAANPTTPGGYAAPATGVLGFRATAAQTAPGGYQHAASGESFATLITITAALVTAGGYVLAALASIARIVPCRTIYARAKLDRAREPRATLRRTRDHRAVRKDANAHALR